MSRAMQARVAWLAGVLALAGCTAPPGRPAPPALPAAAAGASEPDPLVGDVPIPPSNVPAAKGLLAEDDPRPGSLPPLPDANGPTSPAALTGAAAKSVPADKGKTGASLGGPRRPAVDVPPPGALIQAGATAPAGAAETWEQLQQRLAARGVVWQQLKNDNQRPDQWTFHCAIPERDNRDRREVFVGEGAGPLAAIKAALAQMEK